MTASLSEKKNILQKEYNKIKQWKILSFEILIAERETFVYGMPF